MKLRFKTSDVRRLCLHSIDSGEHLTLYGEPTGPGLLLVGDQGVYLMSTGKEQVKVKAVHNGKEIERSDVVYAEECNPETLPFDDWWANKQASFGGDDGVEYLDMDSLVPALDREWFVLDIGPTSFTVSSEGAKLEAGVIRGG